MPYLLDTDWFIDYLNRDPDAIRLIESLIPEGLALSVISFVEAYEGVLRLDADDLVTQRFERWTSENVVIVFDAEVARRAGEIRRVLRDQGLRFNNRAMDILIAATAIAHGLTLVTRNLKDYRDIPGLSLYEQP